MVVYTATDERLGNAIGVWKLYKKDGEVQGSDENFLEDIDKEHAGTRIKTIINYFKKFGGTKDLSYLLQGKQEGGDQSEQESAPTSGTTEDGIEWEISAAFKKRRKSKYNGKNVTGYDEGMFEMADGAAVSSSRKVFSNILCPNNN